MSTVATVGITGATAPASLALSVSGLPSGTSVSLTQPSSTANGSLTIGSGSAQPGTYVLTVKATDSTGAIASSAALNLQIGDLITLSNTATATNNLAMSTSMELGWRNISYSSDEQTKIAALSPTHIRIQPVVAAIPQSSATAWNFSYLDAVTQQLLALGDQSPLMQITRAPAFMYNSSTNTLSDSTYQQVSDYAKNLVYYYNKGGFTAGGTKYVSPSSTPIRWWSILNENNYSGYPMTGSEYARLYNTMVPAMQSVDSTLHFAALEMGVSKSLDSTYLTAFTQAVTAQVDAVALHFYSTCHQSDTDATLFATIPTFVTNLQQIRNILATNASLASAPLWITENNVNADYNYNNTGMSACTPTQTFVLDTRGSSAFFAAWRPYLYAQFARQGVSLLHQFEIEGDTQFGELARGGAYQLGYWVDQALQKELQSASGAPTILTASSTDAANVEVFPLRHVDGHVTVMIVNHRVLNSADNNGSGAPAIALVNFSALGSFTSAKLLTLDANTNVLSGPTATAISATSPAVISFAGYGVAFLDLD